MNTNSSLLALCVVSSVTLACASRPSADEAAETARRYIAAIDAKQWEAAAALVDTAAQRRFRDRALVLVVNIAEHRDELRAMMSGTGSGGMSATSLDTSVTAANLARYGGWRVPLYAGASTVAELAALSPTEFLARSFPVAEMMCREGDCMVMEDSSQVQVLGAEVKGDSARAFVRLSAVPEAESGAASSRSDTIRLVRRGNVWRIDSQRGPIPSLLTLVDERMGVQPPKR
jgi:hypothetical protein